MDEGLTWIRIVKDFLPMKEIEESGLWTWLIAKGFFSAPASTKYHGASINGLVKHSFNVAHKLDSMSNELTFPNCRWDRPESPKIVGLFHDLCKIDSYRYVPETGKYEYRTDNIVTGHGMKSVIYLQQFIKLTEQEIACMIYHMGAFTDSKEWNNYTNAIKKYPEVLLTHTADMYITHVLGL